MKKYKITRYQINSKKLNKMKSPIKMVFLSDLHEKEYGYQNEQLYHSILEERPDIIVIGGDMVIGKKYNDLMPTVEFVTKLTKIAPVVYGNGNHEQRMKERPNRFLNKFQLLKEKLISGKIQMIENQNLDIVCSGNELRFLGLEIPAKYYDKMMKEILSDSEMLTAIGNANKEKYNILLAHNPAHMETYVRWGADLVLSGHFHGGIIRLPFLGGVISPQGKLFPKYSRGYYKKNNTDIVVSGGLGEHTIKIRFRNKPELIVISLSGEK